ncbi:MAG: ribosome maturation factor RimM [Betaproteobacteria bacterium]|nr:ribosome maturation factor RimM [Betaproteobacteria bacterium]
MIVLGRVSEPYGVKGWVRIQPFGDDPLAWRQMQFWHLAVDENGIWQAYELLCCEARGAKLIAHFAGVDDRNAAEFLRGFLIAAPRDSLPATAEGEFYWADLLEMRVETLAAEPLGVVAGLLETGAHAVLRVEDTKGRERFLPFVSAIVHEVDAEKRLIRVDWAADWE